MRFSATIERMCKRIVNTAAALFLSILLVVGTSFPVPLLQSYSYAYADELDDARATLDSASQRLSQITAEYEQIQAGIAEIETQIQVTTQQVLDAQAAMLQGQEVLGSAVAAAYKDGNSYSLLSIFLMSDSLTDFLRNIDYYDAIQQQQAEVVEAQRQLREAFYSALDELDGQKEAQQIQLDAAEAKRAEAQQVVADASAQVSALEAEQARLAELQAQAEALRQQQEAENNTPLDPNWNTGDAGGSGSGAGGGATSGGAVDENFDPTAGWQTGVASAYGGETDPNTPNPGITANGSICDDNSMGVAIPMSWPNYRSYFGRMVEIRYNGRTVLATINDCGSMGGGSRSLDLQPGVWKAFGFDSCQAWGLRTVSYRII